MKLIAVALLPLALCAQPAINTEYQGEVLSWRDSQIVVRVKGYSVLRFWKRTGMEVGNKDYERRGFFLAIEQLDSAGGYEVVKLDSPGIKINLEEQDGALPVVQKDPQ